MNVSLTLGIQRFPLLPREASSGDDPAPQAKQSNRVRDPTSPKPRCRPISTPQVSIGWGPYTQVSFPLLFLMLLYYSHVTTKPTVKMSQAKHQHSRCSEQKVGWNRNWKVMQTRFRCSKQFEMIQIGSPFDKLQVRLKQHVHLRTQVVELYYFQACFSLHLILEMRAGSLLTYSSSSFPI